MVRRLRQLDTPDPKVRHGAVTVGNFDGVHRGHLKLLEALRRQADRVGGPAVVFTFDPHPLTLLQPQKAPVPLTWTDRKVELLGQHGVDVVWTFPTDPQLLSYTALEFFERIVIDRLAAKAMVEGPNFRFGKGRDGSVEKLSSWCSERGLRFEIVSAVTSPETPEAEPISSTRIRQWIAAGQIALANRWLTAPYRLRGQVVSGDQRGRVLGFPTANLSGIDTLIPAPGVYAGYMWLAARKLQAAIHVGANLTFDQQDPRVEVHVLNFSEDLYGQQVQVEFIDRIRDSARFDSPQALQAQLKADVADTARRLAQDIPDQDFQSACRD